MMQFRYHDKRFAKKNNQYLYCPENPEKCEDHRKAWGFFWEKTRNVWCR